jgi:alpha-galactosidase
MLLFASLVMMSQAQTTSQCGGSSEEVIALRIPGPLRLDAAHPSSDWDKATPIAFCSDWAGKNPDLQRATTVKLLWSTQFLFLRFECHYRELYVFDDAMANGRRDHLWDRDVAEVFLQPDPSRPHEYKEFEISPNGMWIDLDIFPGGMADLKSGLERSVTIDRGSHLWAAEIKIPLKSLILNFDPSHPWKVNFFRVEGKAEPRGYYAWRPTRTAHPNFHVPEAFGTLRFASASER